ncbi:hypothetical protein J4G33_09695 [Actinotalea sp. BY-33]|uniref:WxL domain-containing protein n=1 Tax=Actinotalea soli TaxID=2819234 RepID=A0A939LS64_9CELL|nr:hypothetical protein [Actinotalea soli]MBO1752075.1 hypothetical protein [Actinotalea soli]
MDTRSVLARTAVGAAGGLLLVGVGGAAMADELGQDEVDVNVEIEELAPAGELAMTVASDSATLTEVDSGELDVREFRGVLPTVTVTDDREEVPDQSYWYVVGQSSAFTGAGGESIAAGHLGWTPRLLTEADGEVAEGEQVNTVLDETAPNVGLVSEELLALALDAGEARPVGTWEANADLFLKTPVDVTPGSYSATLTLTLWDDVW